MLFASSAREGGRLCKCRSVYGAMLSMQTLCGLSICSTLLLIHGPIRELQAVKNCNEIHRYPLHQWSFRLLRLYHSRFYILCPLIPITGLSSPLAPENPKKCRLRRPVSGAHFANVLLIDRCSGPFTRRPKC